MEKDLLKAIEVQIEEWHILLQKFKDVTPKMQDQYYEGFRNGQISAYEKVLALIKLGEVE